MALAHIQAHPAMTPHFSFWFGAITRETEALLQEHGLRCLPKPIELDKLRQEVAEMIRAAHEDT